MDMSATYIHTNDLSHFQNVFLFFLLQKLQNLEVWCSRDDFVMCSSVIQVLCARGPFKKLLFKNVKALDDSVFLSLLQVNPMLGKFCQVTKQKSFFPGVCLVFCEFSFTGRGKGN